MDEKNIETGKKESREEGKYVYCIISHDERSSFGNIGIENSEVYTIPHKGIAAVVSDSPLMEYQLTDDFIKAHERVIRQVSENHTVVPMAFGMVFADQEILKSMLEKICGEVREHLKLFNNRVELGIKVILPKELDDLFYGEKKEEFASRIFNLLKEKAVQSVKGKLFSKRLALNASFLVDKDKIEEFSKEVEKVDEMFKPRIQYTGPWPPYNFVNMRVTNKE